MKFVRKFPDTETRDAVLAIVEYEVLSYTNGVGVKIKTQGSGPEPVVPTDRIILKFMVTDSDWNNDAGKYQKMLIADDCGNPAYDGSCFDYMIKDNVKIDTDFWSIYVYFDTLGEHTVELIFNEEFDGYLPINCLQGADVNEVVISSNVTSISTQAFYNCSGLISVTIPNSVTSIDFSAFSSCSSLTSVTIPEGVTSIGGSAFYGCSGLTTLTISEGVTSIGDSAFYDCSGLTTLTIPNSVSSIDYNAFNNCYSLTSITCNAINPPNLDSDVFANTNDCPIYVPVSSVDAYKADTDWSVYASRIQAIQS